MQTGEKNTMTTEKGPPEHTSPSLTDRGKTPRRETTWRAVTLVCSPTYRASRDQTWVAIPRTISGNTDQEKRYAAVDWSFTYAVRHPVAGRFCASLLREIRAIPGWRTRW
jgi:hypothetical protein